MGEDRKYASSQLDKVDDGLIEPVTRGARRAGVGVGRAIFALATLFSMLFLLPGLFMLLLGSGAVETVGVVLLSVGSGFLIPALGGRWLLGRWGQSAERRSISSHIFKKMSRHGRANSREVARVLACDEALVLEVGRQLEAQGRLEREVDPQGAEVFLPLGWVGGHELEALNSPQRHSERRAMERFDSELGEKPAVGLARKATKEESGELHLEEAGIGTREVEEVEQ